MSELTMSKDTREAFLADVHVGILAVSQDGGGPPLLTPVWYRYEPGGDIIINTGPDSAKVKALQAGANASFCVQREDLPPAFVSVEGPVAIDDDGAPERLRIAERYLGPELALGYIESTVDTVNVTLRLTPERWRTQDYAQRM